MCASDAVETCFCKNVNISLPTHWCGYSSETRHYYTTAPPLYGNSCSHSFAVVRKHAWSDNLSTQTLQATQLLHCCHLSILRRLQSLSFYTSLVTFCVSRRWRKVYCGHPRLCVCLSTAVCPHCCTDPNVTWGSRRGCPLVVHYWADLQSVHGLRCYGNMTRTLVTSLRPSSDMTT